MAYKQVLDIRSNTEGISLQESNEQQRNWSEDFWNKKSADGLANYDPSRAHLNFEIVKGGIIQPIDKSKPIMQKFNDNLAARGIRNPNDRENVKRLQRIMAQIIISGSHEKMIELAFGNQVVLPKGEDNSGLHREKDIELWAKDAYNFIAKHYGEENIVSFYVHLDEKSPHIHCTLIPVNEKNRISWKSVFGDGFVEGSAYLHKIHSIMEEEVSRKYGMERGSNVAETGAKHRSTEEYKRDLVREVDSLENTVKGLKKQIQRAEIKLKGITTMINNQLARKAEVEAEIELIALKFGEDGADTAKLAERMRQLREEKDRINETLLTRYQQLEDANRSINDAKAKLAELEEKNKGINASVNDKLEAHAAYVQSGISSTYSRMVSESFKPVIPSLPLECKDILDKSGFLDLTDNVQDVLNCAMMLAVNYVTEATTYAHSCGGGGGNMSGWGRDKDDDDERWWMRCISKAASMVKSPGRKPSRSR